MPISSKEMTISSREMPVSSEEMAIVSEAMPIVYETMPVVSDAMTIVSDTMTIVYDTTPIVSEAMPIVYETMPVVSDTMTIVYDAKPIVFDAIAIVSDGMAGISCPYREANGQGRCGNLRMVLVPAMSPAGFGGRAGTLRQKDLFNATSSNTQSKAETLLGLRANISIINAFHWKTRRTFLSNFELWQKQRKNQLRRLLISFII